MRDSTKGVLAALSMAFIIGFSFSGNKVALRTALPFAILAHRFTLAFLAMTLLRLCKVLPWTLSLGEMKKLLPMTLFYPLGFFSFQILGLSRVDSALSAILQAIIPVLTMVFASIFLKERTTLLQKGFVLVSFFGILLIAFSEGATLKDATLLGVGLLFLSSISSAGNYILVRKFAKDYGFQKITYMALLMGFLVFNGLHLYSLLTKGILSSYFSPWQTPSFAMALIFLAIPATLLSSLLTNYALLYLPASRMSIFNYLATFLSILAGVLFLQETLSWHQILGSFFLLLGVLGLNLAQSFSSKKYP